MSEGNPTSARAGLVLLAIMLCSCASPSPTFAPTETWHGQVAQRHYERGNLEAALVATEQAIFQEEKRTSSAAIDLHLKMLREEGRDPEAAAFSDFLQRSGAGEDTDDPEASPTRAACEEFWRDLKRPQQLIREWGPSPKSRPFRLTPGVASFEVAAVGQPINIRVGRASHPGAAWLMISGVAHAKISERLRSKLDAAEFPLHFCVYMDREFPSNELDLNLRGKGPGVE